MQKISLKKHIPELSNIIKWLSTRMAVFYLCIFGVAYLCFDLKTIEKKIVMEHLNNVIPLSLSFMNDIQNSESPESLNRGSINYIMNYYEEITTIFPSDPLGYCALGFLHERLGHKQLAIKNFFLSFKKLPVHPTFAYNLALAHLRMGEYRKSLLPLFIVTNKRDPSIISKYISSSYTYQQLMKLSLKNKEDILKTVQDNYKDCFILIAHNYYMLHDYKKLTRFTEKSLKQGLDPKGLMTLYSGIAAFYSNDYPKAKKFLELYVKTNSAAPDVTFLLYQTYKKMGDKINAEKNYNDTELLKSKNILPALNYINNLKFEYL